MRTGQLALSSGPDPDRTPGVELTRRGDICDGASHLDSNSSRRSCVNVQMPIGWLENDAQNRKAAILSVPGGAVVEGAEGALVFDNSRYLWRTAKLPYLYGDIGGGLQRGGGNTMFDTAYSRWLPVGSKSVSPDGAAYAYSESFSDGRTAELHLVNVANGTDRVLVTGNWFVLDFEASGIYLAASTAKEFGYWIQIRLLFGSLPRVWAHGVCSEVSVGRQTSIQLIRIPSRLWGALSRICSFVSTSRPV